MCHSCLQYQAVKNTTEPVDGCYVISITGSRIHDSKVKADWISTCLTHPLHLPNHLPQKRLLFPPPCSISVPTMFPCTGLSQTLSTFLLPRFRAGVTPRGSPAGHLEQDQNRCRLIKKKLKTPLFCFFSSQIVFFQIQTIQIVCLWPTFRVVTFIEQNIR